MWMRLRMRLTLTAAACAGQIAPHGENFMLGRVVIPLAHDLFGFSVVQGGEWVVRKLAKQVLGAVDFNGNHGLDVDCD